MLLIRQSTNNTNYSTTNSQQDVLIDV